MNCTIIIPFYNAGERIIRCLDSIELDKKWKHSIEVILIDDGSSDDTLNIVQQYAKESSYVRIIRRENEGVSSARNKGITFAKGDYIFFVDSDDEIKRDVLEKSLDICEQYEPDLIVAGYCNVYIESGHTERVTVNLPYGILLQGQNIKKTIMNKYFIGDSVGLANVWNKIYKKSIILNNNLEFDKKRTHGEDWAFNICFFEAAKTIFVVEDCIYKYYLNGTQTFQKYRKNIPYCIIDGYIIGKNLNEKYLHYQTNSKEYIQFVSGFLYQIIRFLKTPQLCKKEINTLISSAEAKECFSFLLSLSADQLAMGQFSRRNKIAFALFKMGWYKLAIKIMN